MSRLDNQKQILDVVLLKTFDISHEGDDNLSLNQFVNEEIAHEGDETFRPTPILGELELAPSS